MNNNEVLELAKLFRELRDRKEDLSSRLKETQKELDEAEKVLSTEMINSELQKFTLDGVTYYLNVKTRANPKADCKEDVYQWLKDHGFGALVYETVNANSFSAFVNKDLLAETDELPEGLKDKVNVYEQTTVGVRKSR